jgi:MFS family permease
MTNTNAGTARRIPANVVRLAVAQALGGANANVVYATGAIVGSQLAPDPGLATLPISMFVVGLAAGTLPTGGVSREYGRRAAFIGGTCLGVLAGAVALAAVLRGSFALFWIATFLAGLYSSVVQSFRFAATDGVAPAFRPKAISWVMAGGLVGGVIGPQMVQATMNLWQPWLFAASFVGQSLLALASMAVLAGVDIPKPAAAELRAGRPLLEIVATPKFALAALCGVVSYALMNLAMTSAPLAMRLCGLTLRDSNLGIQWHVLAMFGPSFFTGSFVARFGAPRVIAVGMALLCAAAVVNLSGQTVWHFWGGLVLLGLGWNFGFVGASALVVEAHRPEERNKVQAFNDFLIFGVMALGSFSSGKLLTDYGWNAVNWVAFPPIALAVAALAAVVFARREARAPG